MQTANRFFLLIVLTLIIGCNQSSLEYQLTNPKDFFWNVVSNDKTYITGSYLFDKDGSCTYYNYKSGKRTISYDNDVVYPHTWKLIGDSIINMHGFNRGIIKMKNDSLYLKNIQSGDTIILVKSK